MHSSALTQIQTHAHKKDILSVPSAILPTQTEVPVDVSLVDQSLIIP